MDADGDGYPEDEDCDDNDPAVNPGAAEVCNGIDDDCDGLPADEQDADGDGVMACDGDCDDGDSDTYPGAQELCDGLDNNCDGNLPGFEQDGDGDGSIACDDCNDNDADTYPGAPELCDGDDNDCDGTPGPDETDDLDADGYTVCDGDCDEADPAVNPGAAEVPGNMVDEDCDGVIAGAPWTSALDEEDPSGDHDGYIVDIADLQHDFDGQVLSMRTTSHVPFDDSDPDLQIDMYLSDGSVTFALTYDNVQPNPASLQWWSSINNWANPLPNPPSLFFDADSNDAIVLGIDVSALGFENEVALDAYVAVDFHNGYLDAAPDDYASGVTGTVVLQEVPQITFEALTVGGGNGDGIPEAGEVLQLDVELLNSGYGPTGTNLTGVLAATAAGNAPHTIFEDTATFGGGGTLAVGDGATTDDPFVVQIDNAAATAEFLAFELTVTDDDGNAWTFPLPTRAVDMVPLVDDPDDLDDPFDVSAIHTLVDGADLLVLVTSYDAHDADQEVDFHLDTDLDGVTDRTLSTYNTQTQGYDGGVYEYDPVAGYTLLSSPTPFLFDAGSYHLLAGMALADLGDPLAAEVYGLSISLDGSLADYAPDGSESGDWELMVFQEVPQVELVTLALDDTGGGDGDGILEVGETIDVTVEIANTGFGDTGANVTGVLGTGPANVAVLNTLADTSTFGGGAPIAPGDSAVADDVYRFVVLPASDTGDLLQLSLDVTDGDGNTWTLTSAPTAVGMETALLDPDDLADPFDNAALLWTVDGGELLVMVTSHDAHDGDQMVTVYMDTDLDGEYEVALSTLDEDLGTFDGGLYVWDDLAGEYVQDVLSTFDFTAGTQYALMGAMMADIGDPVLAQALVFTYDVAYAGADYAPDDPSVEEDLALMAFAAAPYAVLTDSVLVEQTGNGDALIDPGEVWELDLQATNVGLYDAAAVTGTLSYTGGDATVLQGALDFGGLLAGETGWALGTAVVEIDAGAPANGSLLLDLDLDADGTASEDVVALDLGLVPADLAVDAPLVPSWGVYEGDTTLMADDYGDPSACTGYTAAGNDGVFAIDLTAGQTLDVDLEYTTADPDAVVYISDDPTAPDTACLDGADSNLDGTESMSFTAPADGIYYLVIDNWNSGGGPFEVAILF